MSSERGHGEGGGRGRSPAPDFRYVALEPVRVAPYRRLALGGSAACFGLSMLSSLHGHLAWGLGLAGLSALAAGTPWMSGAAPPGAPDVALVPWGVLVDGDSGPRALFWSAVRSVQVRMRHGRDGGNTTTLASFVTVETESEVFAGSTSGAAPLERLEAHLRAYDEEQATPVSLDLDGARPADATEADCERLLAGATAWLDSAEAHRRLGLHGASYRRASSRAPTPRAIDVLRRALHRPPAEGDPRAFAAIVAAELGATDLVAELLELVQSPHPLLAAVAKQAALRLGAPTSRAGSLDEVAPFLLGDDERALRAWGAAVV